MIYRGFSRIATGVGGRREGGPSAIKLAELITSGQEHPGPSGLSDHC